MIEQGPFFGPQPWEGIVSETCLAFNCPPDVAERQDWGKVKAVLDYRNAKAAIEMFNGGEQGQAELKKYPALANLLVEMQRAQTE